MKKLISGLTGLVLLTSIFAGCKSEDPVIPQKEKKAFYLRKGNSQLYN